MKKEKQHLARKLREEGKSLKEISKILAVSKGAVSLWVRDIQLTEAQKCILEARRSNSKNNIKASFTNKTKAYKLREQYQLKGRQEANLYKNEQLHGFGCMLYWAEGRKCRNSLVIANTDVELIKVFVRFIRTFYSKFAPNIKLHIRCYLNNNLSQEDIELYWLTELELSRNMMLNTTIQQDKPNGSVKKNRYPYGMATITIHSTELVQSIFGAIQEYCQINKQCWIF